ncbi:hypothetical protein HID58_072189 [Brassica napus]|uniref:BnaC06g24080D protein n=2 Tax=Brassica napus TaxID=3708 RepID=A0A078FCU0_BRANA|nr:hypothetical protein HID58_072189 [Brassica napus]CAF2061459.1 unnamed protein product [Brassica napus]CDY11156.1 BnaC06g24080D [Brassica napus]
MMAEVHKKNCPHKIPIKGSYCIPTECLAMCKKQHGTLGSCAEKGICRCVYKWVADMPWESPTNLSDSAKKIDRIVSEHDKALGRGYYRKPSYMNLTQSIKAKKRRSTSILHLIVPKSLFEKKQSMSYNEDVNVKCCACSDPSCTQWSDLYPHAQVTRRNMWAKKLKYTSFH